MRKAAAILALLAMMFATIGTPATAKKKAKAVKHTFYLHGYSPSGELDGVDWFANGTPPMNMNSTEPSEATPKSMNFANPGLNSNCSGLPLGFPTWTGNINGTIVGDATLTLHTASIGSPAVTARLWVDAPVFSCNESYVPPASEVVFEVPAGHGEVEVVFPDLKLKGTYNIMVEVLSSSAARHGRVLYDSTDMASSLTFKCVPASGKSC